MSLADERSTEIQEEDSIDSDEKGEEQITPYKTQKQFSNLKSLPKFSKQQSTNSNYKRNIAGIIGMSTDKVLA